ncbi:MAG: POTRA domain-containing protein, partial [Sulfuricaulis sp.]|nr:POTRA domain-containing protein [Sulfuricaulis sp.]
MIDRQTCLLLIAAGLAGTAISSAAAEGIELRLAKELGFRYSLLRHQVVAADSSAPATATDAVADSDPRPTAEVSLRFDILKYEVEGNTLFKPEQVQALVTPFTGPRRDFGDIQRAVEALEQAYRAAGYSAVQVLLPEQELERGVVTLKVIEARIGRIDVEGNEYFDSDNIRRSLPALREGTNPNTRAISADVVAANDNPAKKVNVTLSSGDADGEVNAKVEVADEKPRKYFLTFDNTGNAQTGGYRLGLGFQHANIANRDHAVTLQVVTSPEKADQVSIYSIAYRLPVYSRGDSMDFFAAYSDVDAGTTSMPAGPLQFTGQGKMFGARYNWILPRQGGFEQRFIFALDYKAYLNACSIGGAAVCGPSGADVTVRPLGLTYSGQLTRASGQTAF